MCFWKLNCNYYVYRKPSFSVCYLTFYQTYFLHLEHKSIYLENYRPGMFTLLENITKSTFNHINQNLWLVKEACLLILVVESSSLMIVNCYDTSDQLTKKYFLLFSHTLILNAFNQLN